MSSEFFNNFYSILEQTMSGDAVDKIVNRFSQYYKTNKQLLRFLEKYEQFVDKSGQDRNIYDDYHSQLLDGEYSTKLIKELLTWISLIIPTNCRESLKYHLVELDSYIGGLHGKDDQITFNVINLKKLCEEKELYFVYKYQRKIVLNKMIYNRSDKYAIYGYVKKYIGDGIEKAL